MASRGSHDPTRELLRSSTRSEPSTHRILRTPASFRASSTTDQSTLHRRPERNFTPCPYFKLCLEYMLTLNIPKRLFDREHNRCYCDRCYSAAKPDFHTNQDQWKYVIPRGWVRFGLYIDNAQAQVEQIWEKWIVSFHGTQPLAAKSIIEHHQFLVPGDHCIDGTKITIPLGHIPDKNHIYTSPTIAYSSHDAYARRQTYRSSSGEVYRAKIALQCRQNPNNMKVQAETVNARGKRLCPIIPNSEIEYFTEVRPSVIPYGLLIRLYESK